jgi:peroxiredoxin Q/BCP
MTRSTAPLALASLLVACGGSTTTDPSTAESPTAAPAARQDGLLSVGTAAPDFAAPDQSGAMRTLAGERGHPVVVYFYPRDATPGCTREACAFRDAWDRYTAAGIQVFGVSSDTVESHRAFAEEHELPFPLLADPEARIADAYGVPHTGGFMRRVTFVIDAEGIVQHVYPEVDPGVHADEILSELTP